jgi:enamine deaminase RidA (YjgF/YER057c/UK114 family)
MRVVNPASLASPRGYNHGVVFPTGGRVLCIAGQVAWDRDGRIVSDDVARQFDRALANVLDVVREAGGGPESIGKLTIFVTSVSEYASARKEIGQAYRQRMGRHFPAMTLVEVKALLEENAKIEIEGIAVLP